MPGTSGERAFLRMSARWKLPSTAILNAKKLPATNVAGYFLALRIAT
jgi:hypothetical protein